MKLTALILLLIFTGCSKHRESHESSVLPQEFLEKTAKYAALVPDFAEGCDW
jgi:hypothetical protein